MTSSRSPPSSPSPPSPPTLPVAGLRIDAAGALDRDTVHSTATPTAPWLPARRLSPAVRRALLWGGRTQLGFVAVALTSLLAWAFVAQADFSKRFWPDRLETAQATVFDTVDTFSSMNGRSVAGVRVRFESAGEPWTATSYSELALPLVGDSVQVVFPPGRPSLARVDGMRRDTFPDDMCGLLGLPLLALVLPLGAVLRGVHRLRILHRGVLASARFVRFVKHDSHWWLGAFEFTGPDGRTFHTSMRFDEVDLAKSGPTGLVHYDPRDPRQSLMLGSIPDLAIAADGGVDLHAPPLVPHLALPALVLLMNVAGVVWVLLRHL